MQCAKSKIVWCAVAQQGIQEGHVSGAVGLGQAMAGSQADLWRAFPMEHVVRPGHHGEVPQVAYLQIDMGHNDFVISSCCRLKNFLPRTAGHCYRVRLVVGN